MTDYLQKPIVKSFIKHPRLCGTALLVGWFSLNILVLATTTLMEHNRDGKFLAVWEPFCWEISSVIILLLLIPLGIFINDKWFSKFSFKTRLFAHALATLPFSVAHVAGMVAIRHLWYGLMDSHYLFGNIPLEFLYEYRKDAQAYLTISLVIFGYRLILRRLQGEASYVTENDEPEKTIQEETSSTPERLLIKKLGREFLIQTRDVEWVEASGNYANLHMKNSVYPMRITMDKLEKSLPENFARIHRSTIVNLNQVKHLEALDSGDYEITLHSGIKLALSRRYRENFKSLHSFE
ncbi:MAG: LytTR family DNA-binding domain-containing protein [Cellvibrio sp.]